MTLPELSPAAKARFKTAEPGFWKQLAETRDAKIAATYREPDPHELHMKGDVKAAIAWCPPCGAKRLQRMQFSRHPNVRDVARNIINTYTGLCRAHLVVNCDKSWCRNERNP